MLRALEQRGFADASFDYERETFTVELGALTWSDVRTAVSNAGHDEGLA